MAHHPRRIAGRWFRLLAARLIVMLLFAGCGSVQGTQAPSPSVAEASPTGTEPGARPTSAAPPTTVAPFDPAAVTLRVDLVTDDLDQPVDTAIPGDSSGRIFVAEQPGRIRTVRDGALVDRPFLDIHERISSGGERGLLGLAMHPAFPVDPRFFVNYTDLNGDTVIAEFRLDQSDPDVGDAATERILMQVDQPYGNHNGGAIVFGPDGMLYIATGDGGSAGDPHGNGQRLDTLLAKVLRIDIESPGTAGEGYGIPAGNPFVDEPEARPEIWLTGLRNPWRMRFDDMTGDLWIGDVGQGEWEEIDVAPAGVGGLDFGWNRMEGFDCFEPQDGCDEAGLTMPVAVYGHDLGCAVIGGVVVRGPGQSLLEGGYVFSDSCSGNLWILDAGASGRREPVLVRKTDRSISSLGLDADGRVLATALNGELLRITTAAP